MKYSILFGLALILHLSGCGAEGALLENEVVTVAQVTFSETRQLETHREVDIQYPTTGTSLAGTLYLPLETGPHPVMIFQFGSNDWQRENIPVGTYWTDRGVAFLIFDRRGLGESGGICCDDNIKLLADDLLAGVNAVSQYPDVDPNRIGLFGFSQGGWVVPEAASRVQHLAFSIIGSGSAVSIGEEGLYSVLTGDEECKRSDLTDQEIDDLMAQAVPSKYDPREALAIMPQPAYWFYGGLDTSNPYRQSITVLNDLIENLDKDWFIELYPDGNHEFVRNGAPCQSDGEFINTIDGIAAWLAPVLGLDMSAPE